MTKEGMRAVCASGEAASIDLGIGGALSNRVTIVVAALAQEIGRHHQSVCVSADGNFSAPATDLNWLKLAELRPVGRTVLVGLLRGINDLIQTESFHQLNLVLSSINVSDATSQALLAIARYSAPARAKLSEWRPFVDKVRLELGRRGEDTETLMTGLPG
ncbi:hypothetical protein [Phenylobacterium sp. 58.2.17]|uniref:hypothetical protein n=1 Tax=Phenylobacterium sp. 58.2.17 TaxID=2969306 RepID=UPI002263E8AB|nr:hypothetical protein [Phenylobacterium sp. 58.2.17]MCX7587114.1 hypothetical protein [Phenylobacterium sp. 58.2.17]